MKDSTEMPIARLAGALAVVALVAASPSWAVEQTKPSASDQQQNGPCQAAPDKAQPGNGSQTGSEESSSNAPAGTTDQNGDKTASITNKLDACGGVLNPPAVNDPGLVKPAPDTGEMRVVPPSQVPQQAPNDDSK